MPSILFARNIYFIIADNKVVFQTRHLENAQAFVEGWIKSMNEDDEEGA
jgi:hypothetical protein